MRMPTSVTPFLVCALLLSAIACGSDGGTDNDVGPASAAQSTMTVTPSTPVTNANITLTFVIRDANNNPVTGAAATFSANAAGVTFTPPSGTTGANGGLTTVFLSQTSGPISITVNVAGTNVTLPAITLAPGAGTLRFVTQPATVATGQQFAVAVEVLDNDGQRLTTATNQVALTLNTGTLQGTTSMNATAGLATFNNLSIASAVNGAVITATSGAVTVQSNSFNVITNSCAAGVMTIGTPVNATVSAGSGCTLNGHPAASFRFTIPAGNATVVTLGGTAAGGLTPELAFTTDPAGPDANVFAPTAPTTTRDWLLTPGTFLASVSSTTGGAGTFTINTTNNGAGTAGCILRSLVGVTATYAGQSLVATDCKDPDPSGVWYEDRYLVFDSRPCVITLSALFDVYMQLRETNLAVVTEDDDSGGGPNNTDAQITRTTCRSGSNPYIIAASSFNEMDTGAYTLTITFTGAVPGHADETITILRSVASELRATTIQEVLRGRVKTLEIVRAKIDARHCELQCRAFAPHPRQFRDPRRSPGPFRTPR